VLVRENRNAGILRDVPKADPKTLRRYRAVLDALKDAFKENLETVVLFGSQARGNARPESDHDLLVVAKDLPKNPLARQKAARLPLLPVLDELPGPIGITAKTPREFETNLSPLLLDACVDGICLHGPAYFEPFRKKALVALEASGMERVRLGRTRMWVFPELPRHGWELSWDGYREQR